MELTGRPTLRKTPGANGFRLQPIFSMKLTRSPLRGSSFSIHCDVRVLTSSHRRCREKYRIKNG
jgi:hypothetical protein